MTTPAGDMSELTVLVVFGGTQEPLDPVRFIGNRSSGKQGLALCRAAHQRGARVIAVVGSVEVDLDPTFETHRVDTAESMRNTVLDLVPSVDVVIMAAAVADYRPRQMSSTKIKRDNEPLTIELIPNPDILSEVAHDHRHPGLVVVGFAAETGDDKADVLDYARQKAVAKGADLLVVNNVARGGVFGSDETEIWILDSTGELISHCTGDKNAASAQICDAVLTMRGK